MPAKNVLKLYEPGGYYHIYNRGVDKGIIFLEDKDYKTFLSFLKLYLTLQGESLKGAPSRKLKNYFGEIELLCYCLMPNHFHLFVKQKSDHGIDHFMRSLATKYVRYFNTHYHRLGPLFQGPYKAVRVLSEYQFIYLSKYIHRNPISFSPFKESPCRLKEYSYSSYNNYLRSYVQSWISTDNILSLFSHINPQLSYEAFVEQSYADDVKPITSIILDKD
jgi:putative transposase